MPHDVKFEQPDRRRRTWRWAALGNAALALVVGIASPAGAVGGLSYITSNPSGGRFPLSTATEAAPLFLSPDDHAGVLRVAKQLQTDINRVTGHEAGLAIGGDPPGREVVLIGTIGKSPLIDKLVENKKLDVSDVAGKWEAFVVQVVEQPLDGVDRALVIAGSDKRGTIYGMYDLSAQIGVSPWYWWADVPVEQRQDLYVLPGRYTQGPPAVKYRGIFINDEAPALAGWMQEKFGGHNHKFYDHVFELILRLRGNYLWPAMWGRSLYDDDPESPETRRRIWNRDRHFPSRADDAVPRRVGTIRRRALELRRKPGRVAQVLDRRHPPHGQ